jgi:hypothetical protein
VLFIGFPDGAEIINLSAAIVMGPASCPTASPSPSEANNVSTAAALPAHARCPHLPLMAHVSSRTAGLPIKSVIPQSAAPVTPRADLVERALPFLPAGSEIRQSFIGQTAPNFFYFILTYLTGLMIRYKYRCVAVTPEAIYVLDSTKSGSVS